MNELTTVNFHGKDISVIEKDGKQYVAMKPIVEAMGLDWSQQVKNIKNDIVLNSAMGLEPITGADGKKYEMVCLPLNKLNGWLFKIPASRYSGARREAIIKYQEECYGVLYSHFHKGSTPNPITDELASRISKEAHAQVFRDIRNLRGIISRFLFERGYQIPAGLMESLPLTGKEECPELYRQRVNSLIRAMVAPALIAECCATLGTEEVS